MDAPRRHAACPSCDWTGVYSSESAASRARRDHMRRSGCRVLSVSEARWLERFQRAGYRERAPEQWKAHPFALDELMRVIEGAQMSEITVERKRANG